MRNSLSVSTLHESEKKLKKGVDRKTGAGYDIAMIKNGTAMNGNTNTEGDAMTFTNATKKLNKAGYKVNKVGHVYQAAKDSARDVIEFFLNGGDGDVTCIKVRATCDRDDSMTDYSAGVYADNITQAIKIAA